MEWLQVVSLFFTAVTAIVAYKAIQLSFDTRQQEIAASRPRLVFRRSKLAMDENDSLPHFKCMVANKGERAAVNIRLYAFSACYEGSSG